MTVGAADLALLDLSEYTFPSPSGVRVSGYVCDLFANVVELKDHDVRLTAVNARMLREVFDELPLDVRAPLGNMPDEPRLLPLVVLPIVPRVRLSEAIAAPRLELGLTSPHWGKRVKRLDLSAFRARSHTRERAGTSISREYDSESVPGYQTATPERIELSPTASKAAALSAELRGQPNKGYRFTSVYHADGRPLPSSMRVISNVSANVAATSSRVIPTAGPPGANAYIRYVPPGRTRRASPAA
jgi:hypothetical protein